MKTRDFIMRWSNDPNMERRCEKVFSSEGVLYSYGTHYALARYLEDGTLLINNKGYSVSTSKHIRYASCIGEHIYVYDLFNVKRGFKLRVACDASSGVYLETLRRYTRHPRDFHEILKASLLSKSTPLPLEEKDRLFAKKLGISLDDIDIPKDIREKMKFFLSCLLSKDVEPPKRSRLSSEFKIFLEDVRKYGLRVAAINLAPKDQGALAALLDNQEYTTLLEGADL
jgi:hypothetical protein